MSRQAAISRETGLPEEHRQVKSVTRAEFDKLKSKAPGVDASKAPHQFYGPVVMTAEQALKVSENPSKQEITNLLREVSRRTTPKQQMTRVLQPAPEMVTWTIKDKAHTQEMIVKFVVDHTRFGVALVKSIVRDKRDPRFDDKAGKANLVSHRRNFTVVNKEADMWIGLSQLPVDKFDAITINGVRSSLSAANQWIMTNGPEDGLFERLSVGLQSRKPPWKPDEFIAHVLKRYPVRRDLLPDMHGLGAKDVLSFVKITVSANYGAPFFRPKMSPQGSLVPAMVEIAGEIMEAIATGKLQNWMDANPELCAVMLMNKLDKYLQKEVSKKIRPYYCFPAHWNLLFSAIWQPFSEACETFLENPESINAHKFSYMHGGADKLMAWINSCKARGPGLYVAAYSDDQLWVIVCLDGTILVSCPDVKHMDMSLSGLFGILTQKLLLFSYEGKLDNTWTTVINQNCQMAFQKLVLVGFALLVFIKTMLASGVPGTAEFDQVASCAMNQVAEPFFTACADEAAARQAMALACTAISRKLGLEIKAETREMWVHKAGLESYPYVFLGHHCRKAKVVIQGKPREVYVPVRPFDKLVLSYVQPKGTYGASVKGNGAAKIRGQMSRLVGVTLSGGFFYPELYFVARRTYEAWAAQGFRPADENDLNYEEFTGKSGYDAAVPQWVQPTFPPVEWFLSIVAPGVVDAPPLHNAKEVTLSSIYRPGNDWADDALDHNQYDMDAGSTSTVPNVRGVVAADAGRALPYTAEEKRLHAHAMRLLKGSARASYLSGHGIDMTAVPVESRSKLADLVEKWNQEFAAEELDPDDDKWVAQYEPTDPSDQELDTRLLDIARLEEEALDRSSKRRGFHYERGAQRTQEEEAELHAFLSSDNLYW